MTGQEAEGERGSPGPEAGGDEEKRLGQRQKTSSSSSTIRLTPNGQHFKVPVYFVS